MEKSGLAMQVCGVFLTDEKHICGDNIICAN